MKTTSPIGLSLIVLSALICSVKSAAAEKEINADLDAIRQAVPELLDTNSLAEVDSADTENFLLVYASSNSGPFLTITVRSAAPVRSHVRVVADSPANPQLERRLLVALEDLMKP